MKQPAEFDAFYQQARERLLVQTFALTGDLVASRRAVRDAFVVAWHRWRRLQRLEDPESFVRPLAWRLAQRRHTARMWHRDKDLDPEVVATLDALGRLTGQQRRAIVLTHCASVSIAQMGREIELPPDAAARELQAGAAQLALLREVPTSSLTTLFEPLAAAASDAARWPRPSIIRRAGASRRRTHTVVGVAVAAAVVILSGVLLTDTSGVHPTLDRASGTPGRTTSTPLPPAAPLTADDLVSDTQLEKSLGALGARWSADSTSDAGDNSGSAGSSGSSGSADPAMPCQQSRYADPNGDAALVRTFSSGRSGQGTSGETPKASAVQFTEASATPEAARKAYAATLDWFAGCTVPRMQLLATRTPVGVGDDAAQLVLRSWDDPVTTYVVGVARTGLYTTTALTAVRSDDTPDRDAGARFLVDAVNGLCGLDDGGSCAPAHPHLSDAPPIPVGDDPALLSALDLPPVAGLDAPWAGSSPARATTNLAATSCDKTDFTGEVDKASFSHASTITFLIPDAKPAPPETFGLTETVGALPQSAAHTFIATVQHHLTTCPDRSLGTKVTKIADRTTTGGSLTAWRLSVEISDKQTVTLYMAVVRNKSAVGQLGFVPAPGHDLADGAFTDLADRAQQRLAELGTPTK